MRFHGIKEENNEDTFGLVLQFVNDKLNIPCEQRDIDSVYRIGKFDADSVRPRTIVTHFCNGWIRDRIFNAKKLLKRTGISIFEDLTKIRYELLSSAKKKVGVQRVWSTGGKIYVWCNKQNKKCEVVCEADLRLY